MIREGNARQMGWRGITGQMDRRNVDKVPQEIGCI